MANDPEEARGQDDVLVQSPREMVRERISRLRAEVRSHGVAVTGADVLHSEDRPHGDVKSITLHVKITVQAAEDLTLRDVLHRHGLWSSRAWFHDGSLEIGVARMTSPGAPASLAFQQLLADTVSECADHGVNVRPSSSGNALWVGLSPSSGLDVGSLSLLAEAAHSHGLGLSLVEYGMVLNEMTIQARCTDDRYWHGQMPSAAGFMTQRLAAVAAELSGDIRDIFRFRPRDDESTWEYGLLIDLPAAPVRYRPGAGEEENAWVLTISSRGWHAHRRVYNLYGRKIRYENWIRYKYHDDAVLLDIGLAADPPDVAAAALEVASRPPRGQPAGAQHQPSSPAEWITIVGTVVATIVVVPFVQAIVGKAGDDAYRALCAIVRQRLRKPDATDQSEIPASEQDQSGLIAIIDSDTNTELVMPASWPSAAAWQLLHLDPACIAGCVLIWDEHTQNWYQVRRREQG